jgi:hypothetical protein
MHISIWQGVAMVSLKFHPGPPCSTLILPVGELFQGWPFCRVCGLSPSSIPLDTPHHMLMAAHEKVYSMAAIVIA